MSSPVWCVGVWLCGLWCGGVGVCGCVVVWCSGMWLCGVVYVVVWCGVCGCESLLL